MTTLGKISRIWALVVALAIAGGSLFVVAPNTKAPFFGLDVQPGAHSQPGLLGHPYVYAPGETLSLTVFATAGERYDVVLVLRSTGQILNSQHNSVTIPPANEITLEIVISSTALKDGADYDIEVGDENGIDSVRTSTRWAVWGITIQEYVFHIEVNRPAYIGGDEITITWSANKLMGGSLAPPGEGRIWVYNRNGEPITLFEGSQPAPYPFTFTDSSSSKTFRMDDLADPNYNGVIEGWFNSSSAPANRFQWTCDGLPYSRPVEGVCPDAFAIDNLGVDVNVNQFSYPPGAIVTVTVETVVTPNQAADPPPGPPEPDILVSIAVWDVTTTPAVNRTQYAAAGLQTDAHGLLTYLFQLETGIADMSAFEVRANASHPNGLWKWGDTTTFTVREAAALTLELKWDKDQYQADDTVTVQALVSGQGSGTLTYVFQVRDSDFSCSMGSLLATRTQSTSTFTYDIDRNFVGWICVTVVVDDGLGNTDTRSESRNVVFGWVLVNADRQEYSAGNTVSISWQLVSNRLNPANADYFIEVLDSSFQVVSSRSSTTTSFQFQVPTPPSSRYTFRVTATEGGRAVSGTVQVTEVQGFFLTVTFDRSSYSPGDTMVAHYTIAQRSASTPFPNTFEFTFGLTNGPQRTLTTSSRTGDLRYVIPRGIDEGDGLFNVFEGSTGESTLEVVTIRGTNPLWFANLGDIPMLVFILLVWLVIITLLMWRGGMLPFLGGSMTRMRAPKPPEASEMPPAPSEPVHAPASSPMTVTCRSCGAPIEITTSKRPIEVMCPRCGNTEMVA